MTLLYHNVGLADAELRNLRNALGIDHSRQKKILNIVAANEAIYELRDKCAAQGVKLPTAQANPVSAIIEGRALLGDKMKAIGSKLAAKVDEIFGTGTSRRILGDRATITDHMLLAEKLAEAPAAQLSGAAAQGVSFQAAPVALPTAAPVISTSDAHTNRLIVDQERAAAMTKATQVPASQWTAESLGALVDATFGRGVARQITRVPLALNVGPDSPASKMADNINSAYQTAQHRKALDADLTSRLEARDAAEAAGAFNKLRAFCLDSGITVPGLSFAGVRINPNREYVSPKAAAHAQKRADSFIAVVSGAESSASDTSGPADAARQFVVKKSSQPNRMTSKVGEKLIQL